MEMPGQTYLFNLSLLAITFSTVSALVMLLRQTMGGKLSNFDVYLVNAYVSYGFVVAIAAIVPPLIAQCALPEQLMWIAASGLAAVILGVRVVQTIRQRLAVVKSPMPAALKAFFAVEGIAVLLFLSDAALPAWRGAAVFDLALTIAFANILWSFVRRISTLLDDRPEDDWDPKRG